MFGVKITLKPLDSYKPPELLFLNFCVFIYIYIYILGVPKVTELQTSKKLCIKYNKFNRFIYVYKWSKCLP